MHGHLPIRFKPHVNAILAASQIKFRSLQASPRECHARAHLYECTHTHVSAAVSRFVVVKCTNIIVHGMFSGKFRIVTNNGEKSRTARTSGCTYTLHDMTFQTKQHFRRYVAVSGNNAPAHTALHSCENIVPRT